MKFWYTRQAKLVVELVNQVEKGLTRRRGDAEELQFGSEIFSAERNFNRLQCRGRNGTEWNSKPSALHRITVSPEDHILVRPLRPLRPLR